METFNQSWRTVWSIAGCGNAGVYLLLGGLGWSAVDWSKANVLIQNSLGLLRNLSNDETLTDNPASMESYA